MANRQVFKVLIFEPSTAPFNVEHLKQKYTDKWREVSFRYVDPSNMQGGYVPPKEIEKRPNRQATGHSYAVGLYAAKGFLDSREKDNTHLEIVLVKVNNYKLNEKYISGKPGSSERAKEDRRRDVGERFVPSNMYPGKAPFTDEQLANNPIIQEIKAVMDAETKLGDVTGVNFSFGYVGNEQHSLQYSAAGDEVTRQVSRGNDTLDNINRFFTKNRDKYGTPLIAMASDNRNVGGDNWWDKKPAKDAPGVLEDDKSTKARLANYSQVVNIDNESVDAKDRGKLSHINIDWLGQYEGPQGNSVTSPYFLANSLIRFKNEVDATFPGLDNKKADLLIVKSMAETVRAARGGKSLRQAGNIFSEKARINIENEHIKMVIGSLDKALELNDKSNPRVAEQRKKDTTLIDESDFFEYSPATTEPANFDTSNL